MLVIGLSYIVAEFLTQSHLATEDFGSATEGIKFTRRFKKYTYWFRQLLGLFDVILILVWKVVRFPWQKVTGWQPTAFGKTLVWDWELKPGSAEGTPEQALNGRSSRRSSIQPLMTESQDERCSRDTQTREQSEGEGGPEDQTHSSEQHDIRNDSHLGIELPRLQLPTQMDSRHPYSQRPSLSSENSASLSDLSH